jgi:ABC-type Fe3+-citrate transport system substrate-binding protein
MKTKIVKLIIAAAIIALASCADMENVPQATITIKDDGGTFGYSSKGGLVIVIDKTSAK